MVGRLCGADCDALARCSRGLQPAAGGVGPNQPAFNARVVLCILGRYDELAGSMIFANDGLDIPLVPLNLDPNDELPDDADW